MKNYINNIGMAVATILLSSVLLTGCEDTDYPAPQPGTSGFLTTAKVLIANASDAAGLTALLENVGVGSSLAPGANTGYAVAPVSSNQLRVQGAGGTLGTADLIAKSTFANNTNYTVFVTDTITRPLIKSATGTTTDAGGIRFLTVTDNLAAPAAGNAHVRVLQLAADAGALSVRLQPSAPASLTTAALFQNRGYRTTSVTSGTVTTNYANFTPVPAGTYTAQVYTGTTVPSSTTVSPILSVSGISLADGKIYTIYTRGLRRARTFTTSTIQHN